MDLHKVIVGGQPPTGSHTLPGGQGHGQGQSECSVTTPVIFIFADQVLHCIPKNVLLLLLALGVLLLCTRRS